MAELNDKECCNSCRFYFGGDKIGSCQRYPETKNKNPKEWCGEWALSEKSPTLDQIVQMMAEPVILSEPKKQRGRPKKC